MKTETEIKPKFFMNLNVVKKNDKDKKEKKR